MFAAFFLVAALADWVPAYWNSNDPKTLDLVEETPINCLLVEQANWSGAFAGAAGAQGVAVLGVIRPGSGVLEAARRALDAKLSGVVLEGDFDPETRKQVEALLAPSKATVVELRPRSELELKEATQVIGTYQGLWPGVQAQENGSVKSGPTGAPWIDTNAGFLRYLRAATEAPVWIAYRPPQKTVIPVSRYLQAICDAALVGAHWIVALDEDLGGRLLTREPAALKSWRQIAAQLKYFEDHKEWRDFRPSGQLALVQDADSGALLSGSILDMITVKHTPVRPVPLWRLDRALLAGSKMAVNVDPSALDSQEKQTLLNFARSGGTLLSGPPGWKFPATQKGQVTLGRQDLEKLDDIWKEVQSLIGRRNLGVRLFNVSSMLSNLLAAPDGKQVILHLVNYSGYPVESVTAHVLGSYKHALLYSPETAPKELDVYPIEEGTGIDIPQVSVCATVVLIPSRDR